MTDGIIKSTGNSRYLKSVPNFMALYPTYEDYAAALIEGTLPVDLNGMNPDGWSQQATPLNKANLLTDTTGAMLGLGTTGTVNSALAVLGQYNQYWWERTNISKAASAKITIGYSVYVSSSIVLTQSGFKLDNPVLTNISSQYDSNPNILLGKYFSTSLEGAIYYGNGALSVIGTNQYSLSASLCTPGTTTYVRSDSASTYPSNGSSGSYTYIALGKPLEFFKQKHMVSFSYKGTNTFGEANPTILTFPFAPQLVIISAKYNATTGGTTGLLPGIQYNWRDSAILTAGQTSWYKWSVIRQYRSSNCYI